MRVAFADDDPNELKILHTYFNDLTDPSTISIDDFSSGEEFLSRFTAGLYDLVILDIFMGDLTGGDVAHLRFSDVTTAILIVLLTIVQIWLGIWAAFFFHGNVGLISVASTALYAIFYFFAVNVPVGKTLFTLLMISNVANLAVISSKCIEGYLFPELARQSYRWSFSFVFFLVEIILCVPLFFYIKKIYKPAVEQKSSGMEWHYLWIIPCTFYLMWNYTIYGNANRSSLELAMRPGNVVFLFFINAGAFLIYSVVSKLVLEQQKIIELQTRNHQLSTQTLDNTFSGSLDIDQEGHFVSSKHEGLGLGTESIIWISLRLIARPNPVPCLLAISDSSACSKFWKISFCFSSSMPIPSSCTEK